MPKKIKLIFSPFSFLIAHFILIGLFFSENILNITYSDSFLYSLLNILVGGLALYISYFSYFAYKRSKIIQMFVVSISFFVIGASCLVYVLSGPDFYFLGILKIVFSLAKDYGLFIGSFFLLFLLLPLERYEKKIYNHKLEIFLGIIVAYSLILLSLVVKPEYALFLQELSNLFLGFACIFLFLIFIFLFHQYRELKSVFLLNLLVGVIFLTSSIIISFFYVQNSLFWWYGHFSVLVGFIFVIIGFIKAQKSKNGYLIVVGEMPIYSRIGTKLLGSFLLVAALSVLLTGYFSFTTAKNSLSAQVQSNLDFNSKAKEAEVINFLESSKADVLNFSRSISSQINEGQISYDQNNVELFKGFLKNRIPYYKTEILSSDGQVIWSSDGKSDGDSRKNWSYYNIVKNFEIGEAYLSDVFLTNGMPTLVAITKIDTGKIKNNYDILVGYLDAKILNSVLSGSYDSQILRQGAYDSMSRYDVYLVNRSNYIISETKFFKDLVLKQKNITRPVVRCKYGDRVVGEYSDYRKVRVVGASNCLPNGWTLLTEISVDEVYSSLEIIKIKILLASLAIVVFVFVLVYSLIKRITEPIQELSRVTRKVSDGDYSEKVKVEGRSEIGMLAKSFNIMTKNIVKANKSLKEQYSELKKTSNALKESKNHLEEKVKERTLELEEAKAYLEDKVDERTQELKILNENLEEEVVKRTIELKEKLAELERFNKLAVGRELKMIELKNELKDLKKKNRVKNKKKK